MANQLILGSLWAESEILRRCAGCLPCFLRLVGLWGYKLGPGVGGLESLNMRAFELGDWS